MHWLGVCVSFQIDGVIDDIISLESSFNDDFMTLIDLGLQLPSTVCGNLEMCICQLQLG